MTMSKLNKFTFEHNKEEYIEILKDAFKSEFYLHFTKDQNVSFARAAEYDKAYADLGEVIGFEEVEKLFWELLKNDEC